MQKQKRLEEAQLKGLLPFKLNQLSTLKGLLSGASKEGSLPSKFFLFIYRR